MSQNRVARIIRKVKSFSPVLKGKATVSFSQFGEDIIMIKMLERYNVNDISYLDIGANDPVNGSNTYNFYLRGNKGVLVEPNSDLCSKIRQVRSRDRILNVGISDGSLSEADYYMFAPQYCGMNTFSKEEASRYESNGYKVVNTVKVALKDVNELIAENFDGPPVVISLDVEGFDETILRKLDFNRFAPLLICVETVEFSRDKEFVKRTNIIDFMQGKGYFVFADTNVNTIFCNRNWLDKLLASK